VVDSPVVNGALRALIVEDDDAMATVLDAALELDGRFSIVGRAASGLDAVVKAGRLQPDVVVLDAMMPGGMSGLEALPAIRVLCRQARIVVYSAGLADDTIRQATAGADAVVGKIEPIGALIEALAGAPGGARRSR
jgi:DNA-binding NarL/FixJ family response regulator